jgi:hypothetical protein
MSERRKSIARRRPVIVYRIEVDDESFQIKAWHGDSQTHRIAGPMLYDGRWSYEGERFRSVWLTNVDTDGIHDLPPSVSNLIWKIDDVLRE